MKKILGTGLLALALLAGTQQQASAFSLTLGGSLYVGPCGVNASVIGNVSWFQCCCDPCCGCPCPSPGSCYGGGGYAPPASCGYDGCAYQSTPVNYAPAYAPAYAAVPQQPQAQPVRYQQPAPAGPSGFQPVNYYYYAPQYPSYYAPQYPSYYGTPTYWYGY